MKEIKNIICKIFVLVIDVLVFTYKTIGQIVLPTRKTKGNLLSSLFIFFIGIIERLNLFEHGIFSIPAFFRKRYVKQFIFIIGFILFLLSLFEWTEDKRLYNNFEITSTEQISSNAVLQKTITKTNHTKSFSSVTSAIKQDLVFNCPFNSYNAYSFPAKKFLLIRSLRI
jgi:cytochrome c biogenesis protein CcdA